MLPDAKTYDELVARFRWDIPEFYNIGQDVCDRWAEKEPDASGAHIHRRGGADHPISRTARCGRNPTGSPTCSRQTASPAATGWDFCCRNCRRRRTPISPFTRPVPSLFRLFTLFGPEALEYRLANSGSPHGHHRMAEGARKARQPSGRGLPGPGGTCSRLMARFDGHAGSARPDAGAFGCVRTGLDTRADDPALLIYTSGTTGPPKGALARPPRAARTSAGRGDEP